MTAVELVHNAAVSFATGKLTANSLAFSSGIVAQIERIYRGIYLLATLKRDEMLRDGHREKLNRVTKAVRHTQESIAEDASE